MLSYVPVLLGAQRKCDLGFGSFTPKKKKTAVVTGVYMNHPL